MRLFLSVLAVLFISTASKAFMYYQADWDNNGNGSVGKALFLDDANAPFNPECVISFNTNASLNHAGYANATIVSPNFAITVAHWTSVKAGYRIKTIGNQKLYLGQDANGVHQYSKIYVISDFS